MGARVQLPPNSTSLPAAAVYEISTYFAPVSEVPKTTPHASFGWPECLGAIWLAVALVLLFSWVRRWRGLRLVARGANRLPFEFVVPAFSSSSAMQPGVLGLFRPVILLPEGITDSLTPAQLDSILTHELRHIRYCDNLTAALHMCVEVLFWFHPVVWWIGAKLMDERERDCDEAVLRQGGQPGEYARGIVRICEAYFEWPLACATGVGGSDLKRRVREIMTWRGSMPLTFRRKAVLTAAAVATVSLPFVIGIVRAQTVRAQPEFEVVSIHPSTSGSNLVNLVHIQPTRGGRLVMENVSLRLVLEAAFGVKDHQLFGAPAWIDSDRFDIAAKAEGNPPGSQLAGPMLLPVLEERFRLKFHRETRQFPVYALTLARSGLKLQPAKDGTCQHWSLDTPPIPMVVGQRQPTLCGFRGFGFEGTDQLLEMPGSNMTELSSALSRTLRQSVIDKTGLPGEFDIKLRWSREAITATPDPDAAAITIGPTLFNALQQLGLKLESTRGPVEIIVIDHVEKPTAN
jgi:bla regulator protein blaR1